MKLTIVLLTVVLAVPAFAQAPMTAQQITDQIMENEIRGYRQQVGQFAEQINKLTAERDELKKSCPKK